MENHFYHIRWSPVIVTIFIIHVHNLYNGCYANVIFLVLKMWLCCLLITSAYTSSLPTQGGNYNKVECDDNMHLHCSCKELLEILFYLVIISPLLEKWCSASSSIREVILQNNIVSIELYNLFLYTQRRCKLYTIQINSRLALHIIYTWGFVKKKFIVSALCKLFQVT